MNLSTLFPGLSLVKVAIFAGIALALLAVGGYGGYRFELGRYETLVASNATAAATAAQQAQATQKRTDAIALNAAVRHAQSEQKIVYINNTITKEIDHYVPTTRACIPYGLIRLLDGAAGGVEPASLGIAPGKPDDACSPVSWRAFAADLTDDYATGLLNAQQLNDLIDFETQRTAAYNGASQ